MDNHKVAKELLKVSALLQAKVTLPRSVRDWQLYESEPGAGKAAKELTTALKKAEKYILGKIKKLNPDSVDLFMNPKEVGMILYKGFKKYVDPVMDKHAEVGAVDTEPTGVAAAYLIGVIKEFFNFTGYVPLDEYI